MPSAMSFHPGHPGPQTGSYAAPRPSRAACTPACRLVSVRCVRPHRDVGHVPPMCMCEWDSGVKLKGPLMFFIILSTRRPPSWSRSSRRQQVQHNGGGPGGDAPGSGTPGFLSKYKPLSLLVLLPPLQSRAGGRTVQRTESVRSRIIYQP